MPRILFVCSANVFRSLAAELSLRRALGPHSPVEVASAGVFFKRQKPLRADLREAFAARGLDPSHHTPRPVTPEVLSGVDRVIAMGHDHQAALRAGFGVEASLFNQVALGRDESVQDLIEVLPRFWTMPEASREVIARTVDHIIDATPGLVAALTTPTSRG